MCALCAARADLRTVACVACSVCYIVVVVCYRLRFACSVTTGVYGRCRRDCSTRVFLRAVCIGRLLCSWVCFRDVACELCGVNCLHLLYVFVLAAMCCGLRLASCVLHTTVCARYAANNGNEVKVVRKSDNEMGALSCASGLSHPLHQFNKMNVTRPFEQAI